MTAYSQNTLNANKFVKMFDVMGTDKSWQVTILAVNWFMINQWIIVYVVIKCINEV